MKLPKSIKKASIWILSILGLSLILNFGINYWVKSKLPNIISEKNDTPYDFKFSNLKFSIFDSSISIDSISILPKPNNTVPLRYNFEAKVSTIEILGVNFFKLITKKDIDAISIKIKEPNINIYKPETQNTINQRTKIQNSINIEHFEIINAEVNLFEFNKKDKTTTLSKINVEINGVNFTHETHPKKIPFTYDNFKINGETITHQLNPFQLLTTQQFEINDVSFSTQNLKIQTHSEIPQEVNFNILPEVETPNITFSDLDWGFDKKEDFYMTIKTIQLDSVDINFKNTSNTSITHKDSVKKIIPFLLKIDEINLVNSELKVEKSFEAKDINLKISNINNHNKEIIQIDKIEVQKPQFLSYSSQKKSTKKINKTSNFNDHIKINSFQINNANFNLNEAKNHRNKLQVNNINFQLQNIEITPESVVNKIPFLYETIEVTANSLNFNPNNIYELKTNEISYKNGNFSALNFEMKPKMSRKQFVKQLKFEKDLYTISTQKIQSKIDIGFQGNDFYFKSNQINLNQVNANIYRSKIPPDDTTIKKLYSQTLRELPFILEVQQVNLNNSTLIYEEETATSNKAGKLSFTNFSAQIKNINSGYKKTKLPNVQAQINCKFMNDSKLTALWTFNPMNRSDDFNIKGSIFNFSAEKMTPFIKPYLHATAQGMIEEVRFNFNGNNTDAKGTFGINYENLKVTVYNSHTGKERKAINLVGNLLLKSNTKNEYKEVDIKTVKRNQDRSFFNLFWLCIEQGLKQTVLII